MAYWQKAIEAKRAGFTLRDKDRANNWSMCAVDECNRKHGLPLGKPRDYLLLTLGKRFSDAVSMNQRKWAGELFTQIESRAAELAGVTA